MIARAHITCSGLTVARSKTKPSAPLTFDLPESLLSKIEVARRGHGLATDSEVVRFVLGRFDLNAFKPHRNPHRQISVRIPHETRTALRRAAKLKAASVGEIIRAALEQLPEKGSAPSNSRSRRA